MKKRLLAILLTVIMLIGMVTTASAYTTQQYRVADALYHLGLFLGTSETSKQFELDKELNRAQGTVILVRMLGKESDAKGMDKTGLPFDDFDAWVEGYVAYAVKNDLVKGMTCGDRVLFAPNEAMTEQMFLTLALRALGYQDGDVENYVWNNAYTLAKEAGLIGNTEIDAEFTRGDAVLVFWNALKAEVKGTGKTLAQKLISEGVFTAAEYSEAKQIVQYGAVIPPVIPSEPSEPSDPEPSDPAEPDEPEDPEVDEPFVLDVTSEPTAEAYEAYNALSDVERDNFAMKFASLPALFEWLEKAKAAYDAEREYTEVDGDSNIDLGSGSNGQN